MVYSADMTTERIKRMFTLLATLAAVAVFAAGCGDDDNDSGGGSGVVGDTTEQAPSTEVPDTTDVPSNKDEVIERCFEAADQLDGEAKDRARKACEQAEDVEVPDVDLKDAKKKCLDAAEQVPDDAQREQAKNACELLE